MDIPEKISSLRKKLRTWTEKEDPAQKRELELQKAYNDGYSDHQNRLLIEDSVYAKNKKLDLGKYRAYLNGFNQSMEEEPISNIVERLMKDD